MDKMTDRPTRSPRLRGLATAAVVWGVLTLMAVSAMAEKVAARVDWKSEEGSLTVEQGVITAGLIAAAVFVVGAITVAVKAYTAKITGP